MIGGFRSVLCVSVFQSTLLLNFRVFEKRSKFSRSVPFDRKDLCFNVLLCDMNFSRFSPQVFLASY